MRDGKLAFDKRIPTRTSRGQVFDQGADFDIDISNDTNLVHYTNSTSGEATSNTYTLSAANNLMQ